MNTMNITASELRNAMENGTMDMDQLMVLFESGLLDGTDAADEAYEILTSGC